MKSNSLYKVFHLLGVGLFVYILFKIDLKSALNGIQNFDFVWLIVYFVCFTLMIVLKSARWRVLLLSQNVTFSLIKVLKINIVANLWGTITPGRIGEIIKLDFLLKDKQTLAKSMVSILLDRIFDIIILLLFSVIGMIYFLNIFLHELVGIIYLFLAIILGFATILLLRNGVTNLLRKLLRKIFPESKYQAIEDGWREFTFEFGKIKIATIWKMTLFSLAAYFFFALMTFIVALGFDVHIPFIYLSLCISISSIVSLLPISISGIGTREAIFIVLLGKISVEKEMAVLIAFIDGAVLGLIVAVLFWTINFMFDKLISVNRNIS